MQAASRSKTEDLHKQDTAEFDVQALLPIGMSIVVFAIGIAYGLNVNEDVKNDMADENCAGYWNELSNVCQVSSTNTTQLSANSAAVNATIDGITAVAKFPDKLGLIVTVIIAAVVIGILVRYLFVRYG